MRCYLAGPMTGYRDLNFPMFHRAAAWLRQQGHQVISPAESFGGAVDYPLPSYARFDLHALLQVHGVVLLPGWDQSDGARREVVIAEWLGLAFYQWTPGLTDATADVEAFTPHVRIHAARTL